jgi:hypothetical protein
MKHLIVVISTIISLASCSSKNVVELKPAELLANPPIVREVLINNVLRTEITFSGTVINTGGYKNNQCAIYFAVRDQPQPAIYDPVVGASLSDGTINVSTQYYPVIDAASLNGTFLQLRPNKLYYCRMICRNPSGISYSLEVTFTTPNTLK